jgi:predicted metalloprotease with PDZ domain
MMRFSFVLAGLSIIFPTTGGLNAECHFAKTNAKTAITYRFQPEIGPNSLVLHVTMEFKTAADGTQTLELPLQWAGETLHSMANLHMVSKNASLADTGHSSLKVVHASPNHLVVIKYDLQKDWPGPLVNPMQFHPVLMPGYFEFTGSNALVALKIDKSARETANFDWQQLPPSWALATSFGDTTSTAGRCQSYTGTWREINDGLYAAGDYRIHHFQIGRRPAVLAVRGAWTFTDDDAISQIQKVVGLVRDFWHEDNFPYFLVTLKPYDQDHGSSDGSAFTNAFWMYVSRLDSLTGLLPQLAHESFHAWNPFRIGVQGGDADYRDTGWFKEGFTEYYAQLLTYRAGELSASNYLGSVNKDLRSFPASTSEYVRGRIIALWLDGTIRRESNGQHSLDTVMFEMERNANQPYTLARIFETAGQYLSPESRTLLQKAVVDHADLTPPEDIPSMNNCAHASLQELPTFDIGLDLTHSHPSGVIVGVVENGPAFAAGLRNGQQIVRISVDNGNPERLAKFTIHTEKDDQQVSFYPRGKTVKAWQYQFGSVCAF